MKRKEVHLNLDRKVLNEIFDIVLDRNKRDKVKNFQEDVERATKKYVLERAGVPDSAIDLEIQLTKNVDRDVVYATLKWSEDS